MIKSKIKSILLFDRDGVGYYITVGTKAAWRTGVVVAEISGGEVIEYEDHWERNWYSVYGTYDEKTAVVGAYPKLILLSQHNPAYVEGVYYFEKEYVECEGGRV